MPSGTWQAQDRQPRAAAQSRRARAARPSTAPFSYLRVVHPVTTLSLSLRTRSLSNCSGFALRLFFRDERLRPLRHLTHRSDAGYAVGPARSCRDGLNTYDEPDVNMLAL